MDVDEYHVATSSSAEQLLPDSTTDAGLSGIAVDEKSAVGRLFALDEHKTDSQLSEAVHMQVVHLSLAFAGVDKNRPVSD